MTTATTTNVLDDTYDFLGRFIAYPTDQARIAHTLWIAHAHLMDKWAITPRLAVLSAEKRSGKTKALFLTKLLTPNSYHVANATVSSIFRMVEAGKQSNQLPTLLYDEIDTVFTSKPKEGTEDLRGLFNEGFRKDGAILRSVSKGNDWEAYPFSCYCALALSGIGDLPDTVLDRSVIIRMKRRKPDEVIERFHERTHILEAKDLRDRLTEWASSVEGSIGNPWPVMTAGLEDREYDIWEPLIAVADAAGGQWPEKARVTLVTVVTGGRGQVQSRDERLLVDIYEVFGQGDREKLFSRDLIAELIDKEESEWDNPKYPLTDRSLAKKLKKYGIRPDHIDINQEKGRGYFRKDFIDAWERHLPNHNNGSNTYINPLIIEDQDKPPPPHGSVTSVTSVTRQDNLEDDDLDKTLDQKGIESMKRQPTKSKPWWKYESDELVSLSKEELQKLVDEEEADNTLRMCIYGPSDAMKYHWNKAA